MYQKTIIIGRVGKEPEMRYTAAGKAVLNFSVAVSKKFKGSDGQQQEQTTWYKVVVWEKQAETISQYVHKGMLIMVEGEAGASAYLASDGTAKASLELTAREVKFLSRVEEGEGKAEHQEYDESDPLAEFESAAKATATTSRDLGDYTEERQRGGYRQAQQPAASQAPASNTASAAPTNVNISKFRGRGN